MKSFLKGSKWIIEESVYKHNTYVLAHFAAINKDTNTHKQHEHTYTPHHYKICFILPPPTVPHAMNDEQKKADRCLSVWMFINFSQFLFVSYFIPLVRLCLECSACFKERLYFIRFWPFFANIYCAKYFYLSAIAIRFGSSLLMLMLLLWWFVCVCVWYNRNLATGWTIEPKKNRTKQNEDEMNFAVNAGIFVCKSVFIKFFSVAWHGMV